MNDQTLEVVHGSGNVFRDFGHTDADVRQAKALLGAQIIRVLEEDRLSTRDAEARSGVSHSEFSRIRQAKVSRFTIDRLMMILARLGQEVELSVAVRRRQSSDLEERSPPGLPAA